MASAENFHLDCGEEEDRRVSSDNVSGEHVDCFDMMQVDGRDTDVCFHEMNNGCRSNEDNDNVVQSS